MPRQKQAHKGHIRPGVIIQTEPIFDNTERPGQTVPTMEAAGPDGRRWFITFENQHSAAFDGTSRKEYIRSMRRMASRLNEEADRMEAEPNW